MYRPDRKKSVLATHTVVPMEIRLVSACIWYTASIVKAIYLCSTWILTMFCKKSVHVKKDGLEYCL